MIRGLYSAASALDAATTNQELVAENLANANTHGYKRQGLVFEAVQQGLIDNQGGALASLRRINATRSYTNFDQGSVQFTGNPLDLTLSGNSFFVLDGPQGQVYTRNGCFTLNGQGELQTQSGMPVRGTGGRITIPANTSKIDVGQDGTVFANNVEVGKLQIAEFEEPNVLQRAGTTLFQGPGGQQPQPGTFRVEQGYREGSNVQIVNEMVSMMTGMRHYEAAERALRAIGEAVALNTRPQG